jgi:WD40 repeat protein
LFIDQFEEVFTRTVDPADREHLLQSLAAAANDPRSRVRTVITLRADFYDRPLLHEVFGRLMRQSTEVVLPLSAAELTAVIARPAERAGAELEPGLTETIVAEVSEQPGALPMLQYALTELFERRAGAQLTKQAYEEIAGVSGALARRAEEVYNELGEAGQEAARQLFLRLVTLGEGVEDTRRRVRLGEIQAIEVDPRAMEAVLETFGPSRLLLFDRDPATREPTVEVAHEALLREWGRLRDWLEDSRNDVRLQRLLAVAAAEWQAAGQDPSFLLRGTRLAQFEEWAAGSAVVLTGAERGYLEASVADRKHREAAEEARRQRELETAQKLAQTEKARAETERQRAEEQAANAGRLRRRALWLAGAAVVAMALAALALWFGQQAAANLNRSEAQRLAVEASQLLLKGMDPQQAALLALRSLQHEYSPQGDEALEAATRQIYPLATFTVPGKLTVGVLIYSPDGRTLLTANNNGLFQLWDAATRQVISDFSGPADIAICPAFSPDGRIIATAGQNNPVQLWDTATGEELDRFGDPTVAALAVAFSPDGRTLLSGGADGVARLWEVESGREIRQFAGHTGVVFAVAYSPDSQTVLTGSLDGTVRLWNTLTGEVLHSLTGHTAQIYDVAYFPDGQRLLTASADRTVRIWDTESGQELLRLEHPDIMREWGVDISPDGRYVLSTTYVPMAYLWDAATGEEVRRYLHPYMMFSAAFAPDGRTFATGCANSSLWLWETEPRRGRPRFPTQGGVVQVVDISPDGSTLAASDLAGSIYLWDAATGEKLRQFGLGTGGLLAVAFSPDSRTLLTASEDTTIHLWDLESGQEIRQFIGHTAPVEFVRFSADGRTAISLSSGDRTVRVWNVATGEQRLVIDLPSAPTTMAFAPDGTTILTGSFGDGRAYMWDAATGKLLRTFVPGPGEGYVAGVAYSPDGRYVTTGCVDNAVYLWDAATGELVRRFVGHANPVFNADFSPDGRLVATAGIDNTVRIWDVESGQELRRLVGHTAFVADVAFSPDGRFVVSGSFDGTVRLWYTDINDTIDELCGRLLRDLTEAERAQFNVSGEGPVCP